MIKRFWLQMSALLVLVFMVPLSTFAQSSSLTGTVTDAETGEALPAANVALSAPGLDATGAATDAYGNFKVSGLAAGNYAVSRYS